jgi:hypothetical protein
MAVTRIGAWSMRAGLLEPAKWADVAAGLGLHEVSIAVQAQSFNRPFETLASTAGIAAACRAYAAVGVTPHVMLWPRPELDHSIALAAFVRELLAAFPALGSVDLDAEEQWTRSASRAKLGPIAADILRDEWPKGLPLAVNGITAALPRILDLVRVADVLWPQAYTSSKPSQSSTPGDRQIKVHATWAKYLQPGQTLHMGLAAYSQEGAGGLHADEAMRRAYDAAAARVTAIRYWSLQELAGGKDAAFVRARCQEIRTGGRR